MDVDQIATTAAAPAVHDFMERRRTILARLDELRHDEGAAVLDGGKYDRKPIDRLRAELESLDAAEGEASRREQAARAGAAAALRAEQRSQMLAFEQQRLDAIDVAERAAHDLCRALEEARFCAGAIHKLGVTLDLPRAMPMLDHDNRISRRLSHVLKPLMGVGWRYGAIEFHSPLPHEMGPWRDAEAALMAPYLPPKSEDMPNGN
ncbi:hypothetical protein [Aquibium sp. ELW1220]|uniref:hypothetical protein n=1 Tax=Aquibium sp. ELW1220 TaxID=2976766 RepID=UPI0025B20D86|nr:hypothetical protein [Aquibium sp. ELW1220]MDN2579192.1 hypothetical protein [Aquibium sp. ELW1220]